MRDDRLVLCPLRWAGESAHPDDLAAVDAVHDAHEVARLGVRDTTPAALATYLALPTVDRDATVLIERDGRPVGHVFVMVEPHLSEVFADLAVVPGVGEREVLVRGIRHAAEVAARRAVGAGWTLRTSLWAGEELAAALYAEHGLARVRTWFRMRVDCSSPDVPGSTPPLPEGAELIARDDEETRRAIWLIDNEAFLDHWNFSPVPYDAWWRDFSAGGTRDPDGWWLLRVDGEPAAFVILDETQADSGDGYVSVLGVRREFRGRGLARWLLQAAFVRYRDLGRRGVQLSVDAENETGALRLYEGVGMTVQRVRESWSIPLVPNPDDRAAAPQPQ